jgi:hypothetical protein
MPSYLDFKKGIPKLIGAKVQSFSKQERQQTAFPYNILSSGRRVYIGYVVYVLLNLGGGRFMFC